MERYDYLILGGGPAGTIAAETIRQHDTVGSIGIVTEELHRLYSRVLLPSLLDGTLTREKLFLRRQEIYRAKRITLRTGEGVTGLDVERRRVTLAGGGELGYGKLLIATGGKPRSWNVPGAHLRGIYLLRTIEDAEAIIRRMEELGRLPEDKRHAVLVGGGFISLEFLEALKKYRIATTILVREPFYWANLWDQTSGRIIQDSLAERGILVLPNEEVDEVVGDGWVREVRTRSGKTFRGGMIGVGIGIHSSCDFLRACPVGVERGILTNEYLETNTPHVWAAGDIAEFTDVLLGEQHLLGNWSNASAQGRIAGLNMVGKREVFRTVSDYSITVFDLNISFLGDVNAREDREVLVRGDAAGRSRTRVILREGQVVGATMLNRGEDRAPLAQLMRGERDVRPFRKKLADPSVELVTLL